MAMIGFLFGAFIGGMIGAAVFGWVVERFAFRDLPPTERAGWTIGLAWLLTGTLAGFGLADGGSFQWIAYPVYLPGALTYFFIYRKRLERTWAEEHDDTFA